MRDPPQQLLRVWDFGQSPQWEEQTPQPELMETGENNGIVSCGLLSMLGPCAFPSRAHAGFCHSTDRVSTSSTSCNESQFKKHTSIKEKTKNSGGKQEVVTATKKYLTAFQHQINL